VAGRSTLGLIPAKGGSTRLARKNIRELDGKPLIAWAADAARDSGVIDRLVLSTEDAGVAEQARALGIDVPFMRPPALARDPAGVVEVALHALDELEQAGERYDTIVILLPTCPLRSAADVRAAYQLFIERDRPFLMSVAEYSHTPFAAYRMAEGDALEPVFPEFLELRSQQMPRAFRPNGAVHILDVARFRAAGTYVADPLVGYVMPRERSIDIDTEADLREAMFLLDNAAASGGAEA
jgi:CMP-N-acetylneuraminic acid synthetase